MKKRYWMLYMILIMMMAGAICVSTKPVLAEGFDTEVKKSVAVASTCFEMSEGGEQILGYGTCFFVGEKGKGVEYLVTNHHVVSTFLEHGGGEEIDELVQDGVAIRGKWKVRVYFDSSDYEEAYIVDYDEKKDIALLKLDKSTDKRTALPLCSPTNEMVGSSVYGVGYPGLSENSFADSTTSWGMDDVSVTSGTISRMVTTSGTGIRRIQTDAVIQQGNSGGPLVNQNGSAVGINVAAYSSTDTETLYSETSYYAINIDELIPMLKTHDIPYFMESNDPGILLIVIITAAVVLTVAVAVVVILLAVKRKASSDHDAQALNNMAAAQQQAGFYPQMGEKQPMAERKPIVLSMAVQHNGAHFSMEGKQILIGRDITACTIVFRQDTPGISGRHCSLSYDSISGVFLLTDLKSTYGTFLANGQRLVPGTVIHLQPGSQFYLGDRANMMRVELERR